MDAMRPRTSVRNSKLSGLAVAVLLAFVILFPYSPTVNSEGRSKENSPPSISVRDEPSVAYTFSWRYRCYCTDLDPNDSIRLTWDWGDGSISVTNHQSTGGTFEASYLHTYAHWGFQNLTVWIDDLTGLPGHNTSDFGWIWVEYPSNRHPVLMSFTVDDTTPFVGLPARFEAMATDDEACVLTFDFGDGSTANVTQTALNSTEGVEHIYTSPGTFVAQAKAFDGMYESDQLLSIVMEVTVNSAPSAAFHDDWYVMKSALWQFVTACTDPDLEDQILVTWIWGDGDLAVTSHQSTGGTFNAATSHIYSFAGLYNVTVWIDDLTGLAGHNVSDDGWVRVPRGQHYPVIESFTIGNLNPRTGEIVTFQALVTDEDYDICTLNFTFGDGTWQEVTQSWFNTSVSVTHVYLAPSIYLAYLDVTDGTNSLPTEGPFLLEVSRAEFSVNLVAGWNLISIPLVNHGYAASTLGLPAASVVVGGWNCTIQNWDRTYIVGVSPPFRDFAIEEGGGHWVLVSTAVTLHLHGDIPTGLQSMSIDVPGSGWSLIGLNSLKTWKASDIPAMYSGGNITQVAVYDTSKGVYRTYIPLLPFTDFSIPPGRGIWIFVDGDGTLSYYA